MRVGFVGPVPPIRGGISHHSARTIEAIRELGHEVVVYSWESQYPRVFYRRPERDPEAVPFPGALWQMRWWDPASWRRVGRQSRGLDRLVLPWTVPVHTPHYLSVIRAASVPVSIHVHNALPHERIPWSRAMARRVLKKADRLVTHAGTVAAECAELAPEVPVVVVAHPPDLPVIRRPLPSGPLRLAALGYLREYKGTDLAIQAVSRLIAAGHDIRLTVAGEPWDGRAGPWRELVHRLGNGDHIDLQLEYQPDARVAELIASHHAVIAPYRSATQSGIVAQGLAAGRPIVASAVGGIPDLITEGVNGTLAQPDDIGSLVDAIGRLEANLEKLALGAAATRFSWTHVARALLGPG